MGCSVTAHLGMARHVACKAFPFKYISMRMLFSLPKVCVHSLTTPPCALPPCMQPVERQTPSISQVHAHGNATLWHAFGSEATIELVIAWGPHGFMGHMSAQGMP